MTDAKLEEADKVVHKSLVSTESLTVESVYQSQIVSIAEEDEKSAAHQKKTSDSISILYDELSDYTYTTSDNSQEIGKDYRDVFSSDKRNEASTIISMNKTYNADEDQDKKERVSTNSKVVAEMPGTEAVYYYYDEEKGNDWSTVNFTPHNEETMKQLTDIIQPLDMLDNVETSTTHNLFDSVENTLNKRQKNNVNYISTQMIQGHNTRGDLQGQISSLTSTIQQNGEDYEDSFSTDINDPASHHLKKMEYENLNVSGKFSSEAEEMPWKVTEYYYYEKKEHNGDRITLSPASKNTKQFFNKRTKMMFQDYHLSSERKETPGHKISSEVEQDYMDEEIKGSNKCYVMILKKLSTVLQIYYQVIKIFFFELILTAGFEYLPQMII
jgi:hypothetical protein